MEKIYLAALYLRLFRGELVLRHSDENTTDSGYLLGIRPKVVGADGESYTVFPAPALHSFITGDSFSKIHVGLFSSSPS